MRLITTPQQDQTLLCQNITVLHTTKAWRDSANALRCDPLRHRNQACRHVTITLLQITAPCFTMTVHHITLLCFARATLHETMLCPYKTQHCCASPLQNSALLRFASLRQCATPQGTTLPLRHSQYCASPILNVAELCFAITTLDIASLCRYLALMSYALPYPHTTMPCFTMAKLLIATQCRNRTKHGTARP